MDLGVLSGVNLGHCHMSTAPAVSTIQAAAAKQQSGLYLNDYSADPESSCASSRYYNSMVSWGFNLHQAGVNNLVSQRPVPQLFNDGTGRPAVDDCTMLPIDYNAASPSNWGPRSPPATARPEQL